MTTSELKVRGTVSRRLVMAVAVEQKDDLFVYRMTKQCFFSKYIYSDGEIAWFYD